MTPVRLEPTAPRSQVKHSTTELLRFHQVLVNLYKACTVSQLLKQDDFALAASPSIIETGNSVPMNRE